MGYYYIGVAIFLLLTMWTHFGLGRIHLCPDAIPIALFCSATIVKRANCGLRITGEVAWSFENQQVIKVLQYLFAVHGSEFVATAVTRWLDRAGVKTLFFAKGSPWENGYVESFNSCFRDELLDREMFVGLEDTRWVVDRWRLDYNHHRPHSSLGYQAPAAFATRCCSSAEAYGLTSEQQRTL